MSSRLLAALNSGRVLLMDGAMGTELQRAGLAEGECGEMWNLEHPERVRAIHQAYSTAGAEVLLTNTFQANPSAMERHGLGAFYAEATWIDALGIAGILVAGAGASEPYILADIGPIIDPKTKQEFSDLRFIEQRAWWPGDDFPFHRDAVLLETCSSPRALDAARIASGMDTVLLSLAFKHDPKNGPVSHSGHTPEWFAQRARENGVSALGVNCGRDISISDCAEILRRYRAQTDLPLFARPNAGTPVKTATGWQYPQNPEMMAAQLPELLKAGVCMVGGCCGTTPAHIAAFRKVIDEWNARGGK